MTRVKELNQEELLQVENQKIQMREVSGIGMTSYDEVAEDDLLSLINQANQANHTKDAPQSNEIKESEPIHEDSYEENDIVSEPEPEVEEQVYKEEPSFVPRDDFDDTAFDDLLNYANETSNAQPTNDDELERQLEAERRAEEKRLKKERELEERRKALEEERKKEEDEDVWTPQAPTSTDTDIKEESNDSQQNNIEEFSPASEEPIVTSTDSSTDSNKKYAINFDKIKGPLIIFIIYNVMSWALAFLLMLL